MSFANKACGSKELALVCSFLFSLEERKKEATRDHLSTLPKATSYGHTGRLPILTVKTH
jgi:hypothetical protein